MSLAFRTLLLSLALGSAAVAACYTGPSINPAPFTTSSPTEPASTDAPVSGLPCDVATILQSRCISCHAATPRSGATTSLTSRADLVADFDGGSGSLAANVLERLRDTDSPMPPDGLLSDDDVATFTKWVNDGMPEGTCSSLDPDPAPVDVKCTSKTTWTQGDEGSQLMTPGEACITCHDKKSRAPHLSAGGTVYPTLHEPDDCYGLNGSAQIILTGADGVKQTLTVNRAGNFYSRTSIALPYKASIVRNGKTRTMKTLQKDADCNKCHTAEGGDAPGRIIAP